MPETSPGLVDAEHSLCLAIEAMRNERTAAATQHDRDELNLALMHATDALHRLRRAVQQRRDDTMPVLGSER